MGDNFKLYSTLGLDRGASNDDIKRAYKKMAFEFHPDKNKGNPEAEAKFKDISHAYNVLSDENEKRKYDQLGDNHYNNGGGNDGPPPGFRHPHHDIFESFFRGGGASPFGFEEFGFGGRPNNERRKCASVEKTINMTLAEVYEGINKQMTINVKKFCINCNQKCGRCDGKGQLNQVRSMGIFTQVFQGPCENCSGTGVIIEGKPSCKECKGAGSFMKDRKSTRLNSSHMSESRMPSSA